MVIESNSKMCIELQDKSKCHLEQKERLVYHMTYVTKETELKV